jgi:hypothetical protein
LVLRNSVPAVVYVNDVTGNDANNGLTPGSAWATFAPFANAVGAGVLRGDCHAKVYPGTYDPTPLASIKGYTGYLVLEGIGTNTAVGGLTVSSAPTVNKTDFGSPGWSVGAYRGLHLRCLTGDADNVGIERKILHNDSDEIYHDPFPAAITAGNTFAIVRPAAVLEIPSATIPISGGLMGGDYSVESPGPVFVNLEISMPHEFEALQVNGQAYFYGVILTTTETFVQFPTFSHGRLYAGITTYYDAFSSFGFPDSKLDGWGLSTYGISGGRAPCITLANCKAELKGSTARGLMVRPGCHVTIESGAFESLDDQPHGAISVSSAYMFFNAGPSYLSTGGDAYATMLIENSTVEILGSVEQVAGTAPVVVRYPGALVFNQAEPILGGQVQALAGGKVRLVGVNGALTAGGFLAGYAGSTAASLASAGTYIASAVDGSSVFRSA